MFLENTLKYDKQFGWIEVICGSMFSGKTEELIRRLKRAKYANLKVEIFKPNVDVRYEDDMVVSHDENEIMCTPVPAAANIPILADGCDVIGIDEAQFFDISLVKVVQLISKNNKRVIIAGLDTDYKGLPFGSMPNLMCEADYLDKLRAICVTCGNPASYSQRIVLDSNKVLLGSLDKYEARCRNCFIEPNNN